jgi:hypothetical protein
MDYLLGGVTVDITSVPLMLPAQPSEDDPSLNWPTQTVSSGTQVRMVNGTLWRILRPPVTLPDGRVTFDLGQGGNRPVKLSLAVPADSLAVPIWQSNVPVPVPEPEPDPEPPVFVPDAPPPETPANPGDPVQAPENPAEPPAPTFP